MPNFKKLLIVGFGSIGRRHAAVAKKLLPSTEIILCSKHCNATLKKEFKIDCVLKTLEEAIKLRPDAAIVANYSSEHIDTAIKLFSHNIPLLIEKPISNSLKGINDFLEKVRSSKLVVNVGYVLRFLDSLNAFRDYVLSDKLGQIYSVQSYVGSSLVEWRNNRDYSDSASSSKQNGGGALLELSHELDYLHWIFGEPTLLSARVCKVSKLEVNVEDMADLILSYKSSRQEKAIPVSLHMNMFQQHPERFCKVIAEHGELFWDGIRQQVVLLSNKHSERKIVIYSDEDYDRDSMFAKQLQYFIESTKINKQSFQNIEQAIQTLALIEQAKAENYDYTG